MVSSNSWGFDVSSIGALLTVAIVAIAALSLMSVATQTLNFQRQVRSQGSISAQEGLGISRESIDWGLLEPNETATENFTVTNLNKVSLVLNFTTHNWDPPNASDYILFSTNYAGQVLDPKGSLDLELYLFVDPEISGIPSFRFDITVRSEKWES